MSRPRHPLLAASFSLSALCAACGGGGGGNTAPPGSDEAVIGFALASQSLSETSGVVQIALAADKKSDEAIDIPWQVSGSAQAGVHYEIDAGTLRLEAGATTVNLEVRLFPALLLFEPGVLLELQLQDPTNAKLGAQLSHRLTILNDDFFVEFEPNNDIFSANAAAAPLLQGGQGQIAGGISGPGTADAFDVYELQAAESCSLALELVPAVAADVSLWVSDENGALTQMFESAGPGESEAGQIELVGGQRIYVVVVSLDSPSAYELSLETAQGLVIQGSGEQQDDPLLDLDRDWSLVLKAWRARKQARPDPRRVGGEVLELLTGSDLRLLSWD